MTTITRNPNTLAHLADVTSPDSLTSPGARWLIHVAEAVDEALEESPHLRTEDLSDLVSELADQAVPIYTHERWQVFVDLAAYTEDTSELGDSVNDLTTSAGIALYMIAERLAYAILNNEEE